MGLNNQSPLEMPSGWHFWIFPNALQEHLAEKMILPTYRDPKDNTVHGILRARILEWVAYHFSRGSSQPRD